MEGCSTRNFTERRGAKLRLASPTDLGLFWGAKMRFGTFETKPYPPMTVAHRQIVCGISVLLFATVKYCTQQTGLGAGA